MKLLVSTLHGTLNIVLKFYAHRPTLLRVIAERLFCGRNLLLLLLIQLRLLASAYLVGVWAKLAEILHKGCFWVNLEGFFFFFRYLLSIPFYSKITVFSEHCADLACALTNWVRIFLCRFLVGVHNTFWRPFLKMFCLTHFIRKLRYF